MFTSRVIDGAKWLAGAGDKTARIMVVAQNPTRQEAENEQPFTSTANEKLLGLLDKAGILLKDCYFTYAVKHPTYENRTPSSKEIKNCRDLLLADMEELKPAIVMSLGATAFRAVIGGGFKMGDFTGALMKHRTLDLDVMPMWAPSYLLRNPQYENQFLHHLRALRRHMSGEQAITGRAEVHYEVVQAGNEMAELAYQMSLCDNVMALDCETNSLCWGSAGAKIRTAQVCMDVNKAYVIRLENAPGADLPCVPKDVFVSAMNTAMGMGGVKFIGHNLRFDGEWLLTYGVDIRKHSFYDTMLAEHLIDNTAMLGLEALALKYTGLGKYDGVLNKWKKDNPALMREHGGFAAVPEEILFPYAAADVIVTLESFHAQIPQLARYLEPIGPGLPSLFGLVMDAEMDMYEMELNGIDVDLDRVDTLTKKFHDKRADMESQFLTMVMQRGFPDTFNHKSTNQVRELLFGASTGTGTDMKGGLGLIPITTTKPKGGQKRKWEWVMRQAPHIRKHYNPGADKLSLQILENQHPMVYHLLNLRRVDTVCKNFFRDDDEGGIRGNLWPDNKLHPQFKQTSDSGRLKSAKPNVQNWSKQAERFLVEIFGKDNAPEPMRSIAIAPDGWLFLEGDLKQAELFIMAGLSGDDQMMTALTTPGKDIHTSTTLSSFSIERLMSDGNTEVSEQMAIDMARKDLKEFEELERTFLYRMPDGTEILHPAFKNSLRVAGKSISFGVSYGRGAVAIQQQVHAETGSDIPVQDIALAIEKWKTETYPTTWQYLSRCQDMAVTPGYIDNAYGRRRYFQKVDDEAVIAANKREAGNHGIQGTVADLMRLAGRNLRRIRTERRLQFRMVNQIHDAWLLLVPETETEQSSAALKEAMETVEVPLPYGNAMTLSAELEFGRRWGEKLKS